MANKAETLGVRLPEGTKDGQTLREGREHTRTFRGRECGSVRGWMFI